MPNIPEKEPQQVELATLSDGSQVNMWCLSQFNNLVANQEVIWDILNIVTKLAHLNVAKNQDGFVTDVELIFPQISEVVTLFALKNFMEHQSLREENNSLSPETILELRRLKLQKYLKEEDNPHD
jgi:hypothetical protein